MSTSTTNSIRDVVGSFERQQSPKKEGSELRGGLALRPSSRPGVRGVGMEAPQDAAESVDDPTLAALPSATCFRAFVVVDRASGSRNNISEPLRSQKCMRHAAILGTLRDFGICIESGLLSENLSCRRTGFGHILNDWTAEGGGGMRVR